MAWPLTGSMGMQNPEANMRVMVDGYIRETTCAHVLITATYWTNYNFYWTDNTVRNLLLTLA